MIRLPTILIAVTTLALTVAAVPAEAQNASTPSAAKQFLERRHDQLQRTLSRMASAQRDTQVERILGGLIDYEHLAQAALASHWEARSAAERTEFSGILQKLVEKSYRANLERLEDYDVTYGDAVRRGSSVFVMTEARSRENRRAPAVTIEYEMRVTNNEWQVVNVITDGQSLVASYRSQFHQIIESDGWSALVSRMRERLAD